MSTEVAAPPNEGTIKLVSAKTKRDVVQFDGDKPLTIDLAWVQGVEKDGTGVVVDFVFKTRRFECASEEKAVEVYAFLRSRLAGAE